MRAHTRKGFAKRERAPGGGGGRKREFMRAKMFLGGDFLRETANNGRNVCLNGTFVRRRSIPRNDFLSSNRGTATAEVSRAILHNYAGREKDNFGRITIFEE